MPKTRCGPTSTPVSCSLSGWAARSSACLTFTARSRARTSGREQLTELRGLAGQLGIAMQNAQLYRRQSEIRAAAEKMESAKTQFMANVSHELRSALTGILVQVHCLIRPSLPWMRPPPRLLTTGLARIRITAANLVKLTGDLLDLAQVEVGSPALAPVLVDLGVLLVQLPPVPGRQPNAGRHCGSCSCRAAYSCHRACP